MFCAHFLLTAALAANPDLEKATKLVADLQYAEAKTALEAAIKRTGNDRDTVLRIYELQGIVYATLNDPAKAGKSFQTLMVLDPDRKLSGDYPPRVMTPFYEARGRASELGRLEARPLPAAIGNGRVGQLAIELLSDPMKMVKKVKFHSRADGGSWVETLAEIAGKTASIGVDAGRIEWWADLVGERDAVLFQVGTEAAPRADSSTPAAVATSDTPKKDGDLTPPPAPPAEPGVSKSSGISGLRVASIACMGLGVVGIVVGVISGLSANSARAKIDGAETNSMGQVTGITQREAYMLDGQVKTYATIANVMYGVGGALAAGGLALFFVGGSSGSGGTVSLLPAGNGLAFSGSF